MSRTTNITINTLIEISLDIIDNDGFDALTINSISKILNIKPPSLYNHIANLEDLQLHIFTYINNKLIDYLILESAKGRDKNKIIAIACAYKNFVSEYPERYKFVSYLSINNPNVFLRNSVLLRDFIAGTFVTTYGVSRTESLYAARTFRGFIHGFLMFEISNTWSNDLNLEKSFKKGIELIVKGVEASVKTK
jgi:AcrR family transcriptional regulator